MKSFITNVAVILFLAVVAFGCQKEIITPENNAPEANFSGMGQIQRPESQCGSSTFATLSDGVNTLGEVEILNNTNKMHVIFDMNLYQFIDDMRVFVGDINQLPTNVAGNLVPELFPIQPLLLEPANEYSLLIPTTNLSSCLEVVIWARVKTLNIWGQTTATYDTWLTGAPVGNGFATPYCLGSCVEGNEPTLNIQ